MGCKFCGKELKGKNKTKRKIFCNPQCCTNWHNENSRSDFSRYRTPSHKQSFAPIYCNGPICRGERKFKPKYRWNTRCEKCAKYIKGMLGEQEVNFMTGRG